jgi:hypothetical protein
MKIDSQNSLKRDQIKLAKFNGTATGAHLVGVLERRFYWIERKCANPQVLCYKGARAFESNCRAQMHLTTVLAASALECSRAALDHTCLGVQELV